MTTTLLQQAHDLLLPVYGETSNICTNIRAHLAAQPAPVPADHGFDRTASHTENRYVCFGESSAPVPPQTSELWRKGMAEKMGEAARLDAAPVPKPEPVAWRFKLNGDLQWQHTDKWQILPGFGKVEPLYTHPAAPVPVPPGWKLVPVEPTFEMVGAARISGAEGTDEQIASDIRAAIAASPEVP